MKRLIFSICAACVTIISTTSSCKKTELQTSNTNGSGTTERIIQRSANYWVPNQYGFLVCTLEKVIPYSGRPARVYLLRDGKAEQINQMIQFMGGELWATVSDTDVKITFRCGCTKPPFESLVIQIVTE